MVNELMACFEEMAKEKAIVGEEDDMEQPRIGALQLLNTVKIQKVDPSKIPGSCYLLTCSSMGGKHKHWSTQEQLTTSSSRKRPIGWVLR